MSTLSNKVQEIDKIKTDIVNCHSSLKNKLINREILVHQNDKMLTLINKIDDIKGMWAGGSFQSGQIVNQTNGSYINIQSLKFKPSCIIIIPTDLSSINPKTILIYIEKYSESSFFEYSFVFGEVHDLKKYSLEAASSFVNDSGFKFKLFNEYNEPIYVDLTHHWYAFE